MGNDGAWRLGQHWEGGAWAKWRVAKNGVPAKKMVCATRIEKNASAGLA
jgi:hypothetical protein